MATRISPAAVALSCSLTVACASAGPPPPPVVWPPVDVATSCRSAFDTIKAEVARAATEDAQYGEISGFPYLRVDRFLAATGRRLDSGDEGALAAWAERLRRLDAEATGYEVANLPPEALARLEARFAGAGGVDRVIGTCGRLLAAVDLADAGQGKELVAAARVLDNYSDLDRVVGLYPLTSIAAAAGWQRWERDNLGTFSQPLAALPVKGELVDFVPPAKPGPLPPDKAAALIARATDGVLGVPEPTGDDLARLIATFAPVWEIDVSGPSDAIGAPNWPVVGRPVSVEPHRPVTYVHVGHALFADRPVLQIGYQVWFANRPRDSPFDLLAGRLDGLIWRVTIGADGRPLIYDTIHACGCYHLFFPVPPVAPRPTMETARGLGETATMPIPAPRLEPGQRIVVRVASGSHYIVALHTTAGGGAVADARPYVFNDADTLRSLAVPGGHRRSLYGADGLVAGSERLERLVLWPMGIRSPGAMRQWGNHATAFVGRRHFDDPLMLDEAFVQ